VALLHEKKAYDSSFIDQYTEGFSLFRYSLSSLDMEKISRLTQLEMAALNKTAELLKGKKIAIVVGHGVIQQKYGSHTLGAILNLSLITGSLGGAGVGVYVLARENNQLGAMDMGAVSDLLPGRQAIDNNSARKNWEKNWKINISPDPGLNLVQMIEAAERGNLKALYIMGENPLRALPESARVQNALKNLEFIVVQDILNSETAKIADVVLPAAAISEKEGSVTNMEGRIQSFTAVTPPPAKAKPDWEILDLLSARLGDADPYGSVEKIRQEIRHFVPMYGSLNGPDHTWIQTTSDKAVFNVRGAEGLITFYPVVSTGDDPADMDYPFTAIVGSQRYHLGSGTRTQASDRIQGLEFTGKLEVSLQDGTNLDLKDDDTIIVRSRFGVLKRKIRLKNALPQGHIFVPAGFNDNEAMRLFSLSDITIPGTAGWKTCGVKLEKAPPE
jgi:formate dehydrogenase alpha subunit